MSYKKITGIYMIRCKINNKIYIGRSKNIKDRWKQHKKELRNNKHCNKNIQKIGISMDKIILNLIS